MAGRVEWYGERLSSRMRVATARAIDETMGQAADLARDRLPPDDSGTTRGSMGIIDPAGPDAVGRVRGLWGSRWFMVWIWEVGSFRARTGWDIRPMPSRGKKALANSQTLFGRRVHHPPIAGRHAMRTAADMAYPFLVGRIARHFARSR